MFVSNSVERHTARSFVVLGVDPGLTRCGYAVLSVGESQKVAPLSLGVLRTSKDLETPRRLGELADEIDGLLRDFSPDVVAIEQVFFQKNVRTAMSVGQASGVVLALSSRHGLRVAQYTPSQVKDAVAGWGSASKDQVQRMVQVRLGLSSVPRPADAADAAAIALCHVACSSMSGFRPSKEAVVGAGLGEGGAT